MYATREQILLAALTLFAWDGYEAVPVSAIAGALGITKGALYKHYKNKRDIFDHILARMEQRDAERARTFAMPEEALVANPEAYSRVAIEHILSYSKAQFRYWTEDSFAAPFRRLLTLEQYRNEEMMYLYQQYLAAGPLGYITDLLESLRLNRPQETAVELCASLFFLCSVYDGAEDKTAVTRMADASLDELGRRLTGGTAE